MSSLPALTGCGGSRDAADPTRPVFPSNPADPGFDPNAPDTGTRGAPDFDSLLPARVRIHPLTRLSRESAGGAQAQWQIACHVELRDKSGHVVKGLGRLRLELYRPTSEGSGGPETQDAVWNIDLRDPSENARIYDDLVTRTYTIYLASLPGWLQQWAAQGEEEASASAPAWVTLKAYFISIDASGRERVIQSSYRLQR